MKKVVLNLAVTLDGFIEGPKGETDWCIMDEDMDFGAFLDSIDTIFYGRVSYDMWGNYQPDDNLSAADKQIWQVIHAKNKFVFSRKEHHPQKDNFIGSDLTGRVTEIKSKEGRDIWLYGGANLIKTFIDLDLIDVYKLSIHPVLLGKGKPLFDNLKDRASLRLLETRVFNSGVVELTYEHKKEDN